MKTKTFNLLFASVFALVFLIGFSSATISLTSPVTTLSQSSGSFDFTVSSDQNETIDLSIPSISDGSGHTIIFSLSSEQITIDTSVEDSVLITVDYVVESGFNFQFEKTYTAKLNATGSVSGEATKAFNFEGSSFCEFSNQGNLKVTVKDIKVTSDSFGKDNKWFVFDTVEVKVEIRNSGREDIEDVVLEWGLYNTQSKKWTIEVDEEDEFDIDKGDRESITIKFKLDDSMDEDLEDLSKGKYIFYVRATGEIADGTHEGESTCASDSKEGELMLEKNFVVLYNLKAPEVSQCGSEAHISGDVWNIGSKDQEDIYLKIYNRELGIDEEIQIGDLDSFESTDFDLILQLPEDIVEKAYYLTITVYNEDNKVYKNKDDKESKSSLQLNVQGNCAVAKASVTAVLESGGQAGKEMIVKATIKNTGKKTSSYSLNVGGYTGWASSATLDKSSLTLNAGQSEDVLLTFNVKRDALGNNLFTLDVLSGNELIVSQPVQVEITKKKFSLFGGNLFSGENKYVWGIGLLNLILIILIIVIAIRISRR
ncbi:MAG TPA: putative S-layer protein [Candidatus Pacearchaeota archaeon]|jgi:hypothetical protein|nr:putative S-layer protein [Candidatus Pacearchaeota archaeon]HOH03926.1 putative S-layer protein [Candidatus Pacearchaeota archaeon]HPX74257.1 putative S-layer protein [Candidatus Pacearchaeota archaeon]HQC60826.1 putative S-layer protein [Candidatus Pacearchaeota archaeon]